MFLYDLLIVLLIVLLKKDEIIKNLKIESKKILYFLSFCLVC